MVSGFRRELCLAFALRNNARMSCDHCARMCHDCRSIVHARAEHEPQA